MHTGFEASWATLAYHVKASLRGCKNTGLLAILPMSIPVVLYSRFHCNELIYIEINSTNRVQLDNPLIFFVFSEASRPVSNEPESKTALSHVGTSIHCDSDAPKRGHRRACPLKRPTVDGPVLIQPESLECRQRRCSAPPTRTTICVSPPQLSSQWPHIAAGMPALAIYSTKNKRTAQTPSLVAACHAACIAAWRLRLIASRGVVGCFCSDHGSFEITDQAVGCGVLL